jgi:hypothetical protein
MKDESSVPAAQKMMDVTLPIFPVEVQNTADSDDRSHLLGSSFKEPFTARAWRVMQGLELDDIPRAVLAFRSNCLLMSPNR